MTLDKYWQKRDFSKTPEPRGAAARAGRRLAFFIQKHDARRLHYDFRLELDGTLKSWAIPKGPSLDPAEKRLAVHVEDHPLSYGTFEGVIPPRQYGAGTVLVWDKGIWIPAGDPAEGLKKGNLKFELKGEKLAGHWALVRMKRAEGDKENWLLIKERDQHARTGDEADITALMPDSVISKGNGKAPRAAAQPSRMPQAGVKRAMPKMIAPQLATLIDKAPQGDQWLAEVKFDGYRALCKIEHGAAHMYTRTGLDWSAKWRELCDAAAALPVRQAWLDGEVVALNDDGSISFQLLQNMAREGAPARLAFYAFDLLYLNGHDLRRAPLIERKKLLQAVLEQQEKTAAIRYSDHVQGNAGETFSHACMHGLEGIVLKRADAPYEEQRSRSWLKLKCQLRQEFVIGGYTDPAGNRQEFGALLLGVHENGKLRYAGRVGTGFDDQTLRTVAQQLARYPADRPPFADPPTGSEARGVHWLKPKLVAEVKFAQWTAGGAVRHASFVGLRADKPAAEIGRERVMPAEQAAPLKAPAKAANEKEATVAGVRITHPAKVLFTELGLTKLELARYYEAIAPHILPHLAGRPLTLVRCPQGGGHQCFFQKHANETTSADVSRIEVPDGAGTATYMTVDSVSALIAMVQMGVLELHTWGSRGRRLEHPDRIIFDLDPAPDVGWDQVVEGAQLTRALLQEIGLTSFVKTTGGKGLHVVVPIKPEKTWEVIKPFSKAVADHLAATLPDRFTAKMSKATRTGRIFVDYLRNAAEATAIAAFSTRARPGAPVSVPIAWEELDEGVRSDSFNVRNLEQRLSRQRRDPWQDYFSMNQRITAKMLRAFE